MRINENRRHPPIRFMRVARKMVYKIGNKKRDKDSGTYHQERCCCWLCL